MSGLRDAINEYALLQVKQKARKEHKHSKRLQEQYIQEHSKNIGISKASLYNLASGKHRVNADKAMLVLEVINSRLHSNGYKEKMTHDDIGIEIYNGHYAHE